jgi:O-antigen ligase
MIGLVLVAAYRPWSASTPSSRLHVSLAVVAGAIGLQIVPLPAALVDRLSPVDRSIWQALSLTPVRGPLPLSVDLTATVRAFLVGGGSLLLFVISRRIFAAGGVRIAARGIGAVGLALAAISLAQDATARGLIYWRWKPPFEGPAPFGPFVNRNHFATWVVMAVPMCLGYLVAHASAHKPREVPGSGWQTAALQMLDPRSIWLAATICLMLVALVASLSRGGMAGCLSAIVLAAWLRGRRRGSPAATWVAAAFALALVAAAIRVGPADVLQRVGTAGGAVAGRVFVWRATMPVLKDFWLTGTGAGTFETVMLVYQRTPSLFRINAAHNHYLQVAAEGGLLLGIPVMVAIVLFVRESFAALAGDESGMYFLRAGALSGLFGVAVQSIWETGLTTPANAVLAAIAAAIVVHRTEPRMRSSS